MSKRSLAIDYNISQVHKHAVSPFDNMPREAQMQQLAWQIAPEVYSYSDKSITMQLLDGYVTLADRLTVSDREALAILRLAVQLYDVGLMQLDWHEGNIMVAETEGSKLPPKLIDFGNCWALAEAAKGLPKRLAGLPQLTTQLIGCLGCLDFVWISNTADYVRAMLAQPLSKRKDYEQLEAGIRSLLAGCNSL